jgi:hypothetical protein
LDASPELLQPQTEEEDVWAVGERASMAKDRLK